jgi:hypothetical protein
MANRTVCLTIIAIHDFQALSSCHRELIFAAFSLRQISQVTSQPQKLVNTLTVLRIDPKVAVWTEYQFSPTHSDISIFTEF